MVCLAGLGTPYSCLPQRLRVPRVSRGSVDQIIRFVAVGKLLCFGIPPQLFAELQCDVAQVADRCAAVPYLHWRGGFFARLHAVDEVPLVIVIAGVDLRRFGAVTRLLDLVGNRQEVSPLIVDSHQAHPSLQIRTARMVHR